MKGQTGFIANNAAIISNFILDSYSTGYPIFLEIVQNANDSKSTELLLNLFPHGIDNAYHPLLKQPFMIIANDGPFTDKDEEAISKIATGSKGSNKNAIGRFGVGMKSLFHMCDAIFYFTTDGDLHAASLSPSADINGKEPQHEDWNISPDQFEEDIHELQKIVSTYLDKKKTHFCLCIPLRQRSSLIPLKKDYYDGITKLSDIFNVVTRHQKKGDLSDFVLQLQKTMATLSVTSKTGTLRNIKLTSPDEVIECTLANDKIKIDVNGNRIESSFISQKIIPPKEAISFKEILDQSQAIPTDYINTDQGFANINATNSIYDCSITLLKIKEDKPLKSLEISWASYLPLKDENQIFKSLLDDSEYSYVMILNGAFGIDSGRNKIIKFDTVFREKFPETEEEMRNELSKIDSVDDYWYAWNSILIKMVICPNIPSFLLENAKKSLRISNKDFNSILVALSNTPSIRKLSEFCLKNSSIVLVGYSDWILNRDQLPIVLLPLPLNSFFEKADFIKLLDILSCNKKYQIGFYGDYSGWHNVKYDVLSTASREANIMKVLSSEPYIDFFSQYEFCKFFSLILQKADLIDSDVLPCLDLIKAVFIQALDSKTSIPIPSFENVVFNFSQAFNKTNFPYYICPTSLKSKQLEYSWLQEDPIILVPNSFSMMFLKKEGKEDEQEFIDKILIPTIQNIGIDLAGYVLDDLYEKIYGKEKYPEIIREYSDYSFMKVRKRNSQEDLLEYVSYNKCIDKLYLSRAFDEAADIKLLYEFAPSLESHYEITTDAAKNIYKIDKQLERVSLVSLAKRFLPECMEGRVSSKVEDLNSALIKNGIEVVFDREIKAAKTFIATDGTYVGLSGDVFLDANNVFPSDFVCKEHKKLIQISDSTLRSKLEDYKPFSSYIISARDALDFYIGNASKLDERVIFDFLERNSTLKKESRQLLFETPWFNFNGTLYPSSKIMKKSEYEGLSFVFGNDCCYIEGVQEERAKLLSVSGLYVSDFSDFDSELLRQKLSGGFCFLAECDFLTLDDITLLTKCINSLPRNRYFSNFGLLVKAAISQGKDSYSKLEEFYKLCRLQNQGNRNYDQKTFLELLICLSKNKVDSKNAIAFLLQSLLKNYSSEKISCYKIKDVLFPSNDNFSCGTLSQLCDKKIYYTAQSKYLLYQRIPTEVFSKDNSNILKTSIKSVGYKEIQSAWPSVSKQLIAMLLFISFDEELRDVATSIMRYDNPKDFTQYLSCYKPTRAVDGRNDARHCSLHHAFALYSNNPKEGYYSNVKKNKIKYVLSSGDCINAKSIAGSDLKIYLDSKEKKNSAMERAPEHNVDSVWEYTAFLLPMKDIGRDEANKNVANAISTLINIIFDRTSDPIDYTGDILKMVASNEDSIDVVRYYQQEKILEILRTLGFTSKNRNKDDASLERIFNECKQLDSLIEAKSKASHSKNDIESRGYQDKIDRQKSALLNYIVKNDDLSKKVVQSLVKYMDEKMQYRAQNIPFELFQNADDAASQKSSYAKDNNYFFSYTTTDKTIEVVHNGRPINYVPPKSLHDEWNKDLKNMLSFNSEKGNDDYIKETGKFGFGFKCCFFVSDEPCIYSSDLSLKIKAGFIPEYIEEDLSVEEKTKILLPLRNEKTDIREITKEFKNQISGLLLFSKRISTIYLNDEKYDKMEIESNDFYKIIQIKTEQYIYFHTPYGDLAFLFDMKNRKAKDARNELKRIWTTTPLMKDNNFSSAFMINIPLLRIDVGRNQESIHHEENERMILRVATLFSDVLVCLLNDEKKLVLSLLNIIFDRESLDLHKTLQRGIIQSLKNHSLWYDGFDLASYDDVKKQKLLNCADLQPTNIISIRKFLANCNVSDRYHLVKSNRFVERECDIILKAYNYQEILYNDIIKNYFNGCISVELFFNINSFINSEDGINFDNPYKFLNQEGNYVFINNLVCKDYVDEYGAIIPLKYCINESYNLSDVDFISYEPGYSKWAEWIDKAKSKLERDVAMLFIARNIDLLFSGFLNKSNWIFKNYSAHLNLLSDEEKKKIKFMLNSWYSNTQVNEKYVTTLSDVVFWWENLSKKQQNSYIKAYRRSQFGVDQLDLSSSKNLDWYRLLFIAVLKKMGRTSPAAQVAIVTQFLNEGNVLKNPLDSSNYQCWIDLFVTKYIKDDGYHYEEWRKFLPFIAQVVAASEILYDAFTEGIEGVNRYESMLQLDKLPQSEGSGIDLINLRQALNGTYSIILRELMFSSSVKLDKATRARMAKESIYFSKALKNLISSSEDQDFRKDFKDSVSEEFINKYGDYPFQIWSYRECYEQNDLKVLGEESDYIDFDAYDE